MEMKRFLIVPVLVFFGLFAVPLAAVADEATPVGTWKTIDDHTGKPRSYVQIAMNNGELEGVILKGFPRPGEPPNQKCELCPGEFKGKPKVGLKFMWGLKKDGDEYNGGHILDPDNGKIYKCKIYLDGSPDKLVVRGYIGISLIGRSQKWVREDMPAEETGN